MRNNCRLLSLAAVTLAVVAFGCSDDSDAGAEDGGVPDAASTDAPGTDAASTDSITSDAASSDATTAGDGSAAGDTSASTDAVADSRPVSGDAIGSSAISATLNGTAKSFNMNVSSSASGTNRTFTGHASVTTADSLTISVKDAVGTYDCKAMPSNSIIYVVGEGAAFATSSSGFANGTCSITVATVATASGQFWTGTFTATLTRNTSSNPSPIQVTNGSFSVKRP